MPPEKFRHSTAKGTAAPSGFRNRSLFLLFTGAALLIILGAAGDSKPRQDHPRQKLAKPRQLDKSIQWRRNPKTGELELVQLAAPAPDEDAAPVPPAPRVIRGPVTLLVPITCSVFASDGTPLRDLQPKNFRVYDDGVERPLLIFDRPSQDPARVALVIDASPSVLRDSGEMKQAAGALIEGLAPADELAVVDFSAHTYLQSGFTDVRELLRRALDRVDVRELLGDTGGSNIYEAVYLTAHELFVTPFDRKAIVLLTDGQDSGLGLTLDPDSAMPRTGAPDNRLTFDDVTRELAAKDIQIFVVSTENRPKPLTPAMFAAHRGATFLTGDARKSGIPPYTLYLAEIVRRSGGEIYFLHESGSLAAAFSQIAQRVGLEYTLGISPAPTSPRIEEPHFGWRVVTEGVGDSSVVHRSAYYVPAQ
jgi:VWFA-related protein